MFSRILMNYRDLCVLTYVVKCRYLRALTYFGEMSRFTRFDACRQNVAIYALFQAQNFGFQESESLGMGTAGLCPAALLQKRAEKLGVKVEEKSPRCQQGLPTFGENRGP